MSPQAHLPVPYISVIAHSPGRPVMLRGTEVIKLADGRQTQNRHLFSRPGGVHFLGQGAEDGGSLQNAYLTTVDK